MYRLLYFCCRGDPRTYVICAPFAVGSHGANVAQLVRGGASRLQDACEPHAGREHSVTCIGVTGTFPVPISLPWPDHYWLALLSAASYRLSPSPPPSQLSPSPRTRSFLLAVQTSSYSTSSTTTSIRIPGRPPVQETPALIRSLVRTHVHTVTINALFATSGIVSILDITVNVVLRYYDANRIVEGCGST